VVVTLVYYRLVATIGPGAQAGYGQGPGPVV